VGAKVVEGARRPVRVGDQGGEGGVEPGLGPAGGKGGIHGHHGTAKRVGLNKADVQRHGGGHVVAGVGEQNEQLGGALSGQILQARSQPGCGHQLSDQEPFGQHRRPDLDRPRRVQVKSPPGDARQLSSAFVGQVRYGPQRFDGRRFVGRAR
jgi:hypothetical protein